MGEILTFGGGSVDPISLEVGERLVVFGPNGSGKTTLLRAIARDQATAYLPQRPYLFRGTARHNLTLGLDDDHADGALDLATRLGVARVLEQPARSLSGGERQRLALARVLARPDRLVLLDEPMGAIDVRDRVALTTEVAQAVGDRTAIVVTHDEATAVALGDQIAVLLDGVVRQRGSMSEVFGLPVDEDVARVVGLRNVVEGDVTKVEDGLVAISCGPIVVWAVGELSVGSRARALFGGETVTIATKSALTSARNRWSGRVEAVRTVGRLVEVIVDVGAPIAAMITPGSLEALDLEPGAQVAIAVKATAVRAVAVATPV